VSSILSYAGRTVDLVAYRGVYPNTTNQRLSQSLIGDADGGQLCTGLDKICQRFLFIFLTPKGSMLYSPLTGTAFMLVAMQQGFRTVADVQLAFGSSRLDAVRQMKAVEVTTDPLDEQLDSVTLLGVTLSAETASLSISIVTQAGTSRTLIAPITVGLK
jgi:hypothetical protein